jgi:hypothetical protein
MCVLTVSCTTGKFWHRHRRPRPVVYNPDPEYHLGLRTETDKSKILADSETRESQKVQGNQREDEAQLCTHEKEDEEH